MLHIHTHQTVSRPAFHGCSEYLSNKHPIDASCSAAPTAGSSGGQNVLHSEIRHSETAHAHSHYPPSYICINPIRTRKRGVTYISGDNHNVALC